MVEVDCAERLHLCHAACCGLDVALSAQEIEGGAVRWDLGPYVIRHTVSGQCIHNDPDSSACGVDADRVQPCRRYTCSTGERIWNDFETRCPTTLGCPSTWLRTSRSSSTRCSRTTDAGETEQAADAVR